MRFATATAIAGALCFLLAATATAEVTTTHLDTDAELLDYLSDTLFVSEGRIGDLGGAATFELDLGNDTGAPAVTAQHDWQSGSSEPFTIDYDNSTGLVTFTLGGKTLQYTTGYSDFDVIFIRGRAVETETSVSVDGIEVDGESIDDSVLASGSGNGLDILLIYGVDLNDGFTLNATAVLTWTGEPPTQSRLAFQVKTARSAIVESDDTSWGAVKSTYR